MLVIYTFIYSLMKPTMKGAIFIVFFSGLCLLATVHGGKKHDPLRELLKAYRAKGLGDFVVRDDAWSDEYSPVYVAPQDGLKEADEIFDLPGSPNVSFSQYSGYVTVDPTAGRALFYWLTESDDSATKPLVLWLNGGPGCSSVGNGAMTELGPFRVSPDGKTLWYNTNAWNNAANILFLESPAGVGFSYSNTSSDYTTGDTKTAADSYTFLVNWLDRFPEYKTRDFYITGESYAGHYVPQLAQLILHNNKNTNQTVINLKGIAIGNALIDYTDELTGIYDFYWTHALISDEHHDAIVKSCNFTSASTITDACVQAMDTAAGDAGDLFLYDIYAPLCGSNSTAPSLSSFDPCSPDYVSTYLNTPEVQKALHANVTGIPRPWENCSEVVIWNQAPETVLPVIKELMASGIRVWIYSGDTDGAVPVTTTRYSMNKLGTPVKTPWYPWYNQGEVGGYVVGYENITFVTIRGSGHFLPSYQPERALAFFSSFLEDWTAYIDYVDEISGSYDFFWSHALLSDEHHDGIVKNCNFTSASTITEACVEAMDAADGDTGDIFPYDIYAPFCGSNITAAFDPCSGDYVYNYLNTPQVQKALHANTTGIPRPWDSCSDVISWNDEPETVLPVIKELMGSGISVWIYSGDVDGVVPVTTTRYSMNKLGAPVKTPWYPGITKVGGYAVGYENITFVTIRGAGHFVPSYQPERALAFFSSFLEGKLPPSS